MWRPFGLALALATVGFLMPVGWLPAGPEMPSLLSRLPIAGDKLAHAVVFAVLMFLGLWALGQQSLSRTEAVAASPLGEAARLFVLLMVYAIVIEGLQIAVPTRGAEWTDLVADGFGCLAVCLPWWLLLRRMRQ